MVGPDIPKVIQSHGRHPVTRVLDDASYRVALLAKLHEETREAQQATAEDLPSELADILEVTRALATAVGISLTRRQALPRHGLQQLHLSAAMRRP